MIPYIAMFFNESWKTKRILVTSWSAATASIMHRTACKKINRDKWPTPAFLQTFLTLGPTRVSSVQFTHRGSWHGAPHLGLPERLQAGPVKRVGCVELTPGYNQPTHKYVHSARATSEPAHVGHLTDGSPPRGPTAVDSVESPIKREMQVASYWAAPRTCCRNTWVQPPQILPQKSSTPTATPQLRPFQPTSEAGVQARPLNPTWSRP